MLGQNRCKSLFSIAWVVYNEAVLSLLLLCLTRVASSGWRTMELVGERRQYVIKFYMWHAARTKEFSLLGLIFPTGSSS